MASKSKLPLHKRASVRKIMRETIATMRLNGNWKFYNQGTWGHTSTINHCETECCFCGWIDWGLDKKRHNQSPSRSDERVYGFFKADYGTIRPFDHSGSWPDEFRNAFAMAEGIERVNVLQRRVEHWFKTGE